jgi:hypothetical protein
MSALTMLESVQFVIGQDGRPTMVSALIAALDRLLSETEAGDWVGQVRWLNRWRQK